jgi:hypothetical protein
MIYGSGMMRKEFQFLELVLCIGRVWIGFRLIPVSKAGDGHTYPLKINLIALNV